VAQPLAGRLHHRAVLLGALVALPDLLTVDVRPVEASQVLHPDARRIDLDQAVLPRHRRVARQANGAAPRPSQDQVRVAGENKLPATQIAPCGREDQSHRHNVSLSSSTSTSTITSSISHADQPSFGPKNRSPTGGVNRPRGRCRAGVEKVPEPEGLAANGAGARGGPRGAGTGRRAGGVYDPAGGSRGTARSVARSAGGRGRGRRPTAPRS